MTRTEDQRLDPSEPTPNQSFGEFIDADGDTAVIGARYAHGVVPGTGAAEVFARRGGAWSWQARLIAADGAQADRFGQAVAVSGDWIAVGAPEDDDLGFETGAVYLFERAGDAWSQGYKLLADDTALGDFFGCSVALDGSTLLVGARGDDDVGSASGSAYVFVHDGTGWVQQAKLVASDGGSPLQFGFAVSISGDAAFVTMPKEGGLTGSAYVFRRQGSAWSEEEKLQASDGMPGDVFGECVSGDGDRVAVAAISRDVGGVFYAGSVYVFQFDGASWHERWTLTASDPSHAGHFGLVLALDGDRLLAGSARAGYALRLDGGTWNEVAKLDSHDPEHVGLGFGVGIAGDTALVGASGTASRGAAYAYGEPFATTAYCFGDGSGSPCPCVNESTPGSGGGCRNSSGLAGRIDPLGSTSAGADDLTVDAQSLLPGAPCLLFAGENAIAAGAGLPFGDGLRCAGGNVRRLGIEAPDAMGAASFGPGLGASTGWTPGDVRYLQVWYRDPSGGPCGTTFNTTNGLRIRFTL